MSKKIKKGDDGKRDTIKNPNTQSQGGNVTRPGAK
jgi:hypothetical protein|tara:strand:- start:634 stop:738 length:105 start_codon:yes stop_codon:yes gene_type:complete